MDVEIIETTGSITIAELWNIYDTHCKHAHTHGMQTTARGAFYSGSDAMLAIAMAVLHSALSLEEMINIIGTLKVESATFACEGSGNTKAAPIH